MFPRPLQGETGSDEVERAAEARRILFDMGLAELAVNGPMLPKEATFVDDLAGKLREAEAAIEQYPAPPWISPRQLFFLRDIKDRYL